MQSRSARPRGQPAAALASLAYLLLAFVVSWASAAELGAGRAPTSSLPVQAAPAQVPSIVGFTRPVAPAPSPFIPTAAADTPGPVPGQEVAFRGSDAAIWLGGWDGMAWRGWWRVGGPAASAPAVASWGPGRLDIFAAGFEGGVWHRWWEGGWHGWEWLGGALAPGSEIAAAAGSDGRLDVLVRGVDDGLWHRREEAGGWSAWERLVCCLTSSPAVAARGAGTLDVFVQRFGRGLWHGRLETDRWTSEDVGERLPGRLEPAVVSWGPGRLDVLVRAGDDRLWHRWQEGAQGAWSAWEELGCCMSSAPSAATWGPGHLDVFARGFDDQLLHRRFSGSWRDWEAVGVGLTSAPAATVWAAAGHVIPDVPYVAQEFPLSCEVASLRMALAHEGIEVSEARALEDVGVDGRPAYYEGEELRWGDPYDRFVGDPYGQQADLTGYGVYYPPIARIAARYGGSVLRAGEGVAPEEVYRAVLQNHPAVVWVSADWQYYAPGSWRTFEGRLVQYQGVVEHTVTVVGVEADDVFVHDPLAGAYWVPKSAFEQAYRTFNQMAVVLI